jgi:hypothetical protein
MGSDALHLEVILDIFKPPIAWDATQMILYFDTICFSSKQ